MLIFIQKSSTMQSCPEILFRFVPVPRAFCSNDSIVRFRFAASLQSFGEARVVTVVNFRILCSFRIKLNMPRPKKAEAKVEEKVDMEVEENSEENEVEEAPKAAKGKRGRPAKNPRDKLPRGAKTDAAKKFAESDEDDIDEEPKPAKKAAAKKPASSGRGRGRPPKKAQGKPVETPEEADDDEDEQAKPAKKQTKAAAKDDEAEEQSEEEVEEAGEEEEEEEAKPAPAKKGRKGKDATESNGTANGKAGKGKKMAVQAEACKS